VSSPGRTAPFIRAAQVADPVRRKERPPTSRFGQVARFESLEQRARLIARFGEAAASSVVAADRNGPTDGATPPYNIKRDLVAGKLARDHEGGKKSWLVAHKQHARPCSTRRRQAC